MGIIITLNPQQYVRQYSGPLDADSVFTTTAARTAYLSSARRYPGQIVSDLQDGLAYKLNSAGNAWIAIGTGGGTSIMSAESFTVDSSALLNYTILAGYSVTMIRIVPTSDCTPSVSYSNATPIIPADSSNPVTVNGIDLAVSIGAIVSNQGIVINGVPLGTIITFIKIKFT